MGYLFLKLYSSTIDIKRDIWCGPRKIDSLYITRSRTKQLHCLEFICSMISETSRQVRLLNPEEPTLADNCHESCILLIIFSTKNDINEKLYRILFVYNFTSLNFVLIL